eukprot:5568328-Pleurochrysis_carterae.AAC.1
MAAATWPSSTHDSAGSACSACSGSLLISLKRSCAFAHAASRSAPHSSLARACRSGASHAWLSRAKTRSEVSERSASCACMAQWSASLRHSLSARVAAGP